MVYHSVAKTGLNAPGDLRLPAPTAWPIVLALGITLVFAGLVTSESVSVLGAILTIAGAVGWFRNVFPHEARESGPFATVAPGGFALRLQSSYVSPPPDSAGRPGRAHHVVGSALHHAGHRQSGAEPAD